MNTPLRVCAFTFSFPRSLDDEAAVFVWRLYEAMCSLGAECTLFVPRDSTEPATEQWGGLKIVRYRYGIFKAGALAFGAGIMPNLRQRPYLLLQAPAMLVQFYLHARKRRSVIDLVHCNWLVTALPAFFFYGMYRIPYCVTFRGEDIRLLEKWFIRILFYLPIRFAAGITCVNETTATYLRNAYPKKAAIIQSIPNGVAVKAVTSEICEHFLTARSELQDRKIALFVGSIIPRKAVATLITAMADPRLSDYCLLLCGRLADTAYHEQLLKLAQEKGCAEQVFFEGAVPPEDIAQYLAIAHVYVSASEHEGRPNGVLEAQAAGVPVVLSDIAPHRELLPDVEKVSLFPLGDEKKLADLLFSERFKEQKNKQGESRSWQSAAKEYVELFRSMV